MELRHVKWLPSDLALVKNAIVERRLLYQPFRFTDELEVGEGQNFYDLYASPKRSNFIWNEVPSDLASLQADDPDHFRSCNSGYRALYDGFLDFIAAKYAGDLSQLSFAEIGCNTGYFMHGASLRGAHAAYGFDFTPNYDFTALLNKRLGTNVTFEFGEWNSLHHRLDHAEMPEVDVVMTMAVLCHMADPMYHLAYLCDHARDSILVWTPTNDFVEKNCPMPHWKSDLVLSFGAPRRHPNALNWPVGFDFNMRFSVPLLKLCLEEAGFSNIVDIPCPVSEGRWASLYSGFRAVFAKRTSGKKSALSSFQPRLVPEHIIAASKARAKEVR
ncbi:MAG TPA: class I SAM-dependent methyltransferase [Planctomycetaceae bacterium]